MRALSTSTSRPKPCFKIRWHGRASRLQCNCHVPERRPAAGHVAAGVLATLLSGSTLLAAAPARSEVAPAWLSG